MRQRRLAWSPLGTAAALLIAVPVIAVFLGKVLDLHPPPAASVAGVIGVGLAFLLVLVAAVAGAFPLSGPGAREALGLPPGSVRALLTFLVLLIFVGFGIYLVHALPGGQRADTIHLLVGALVTLVASVGSFYYGSRSVESGAKALATVTGVQAPAQPPEATTGESADGATLKGTVNPHGLATRAYFEYSSAAAPIAPSTFDKSTPVAALDQTANPVEVTVPVSPAVVAGAWWRVVAFSGAGSSEGLPRQVPAPAARQATRSAAKEAGTK